jgi:hypothetical protein
MANEAVERVAILYPGDPEARPSATHDNNRFADLFSAFAAQGVHAQPAVYDDSFCAQVREQLLRVDAVLVWLNPLDGDRRRAVLDAMLRDVAAAGVFVSTHPDVILKLGTKEVLYRTQDLGCGCDTHLYADIEQMRQLLPARLATGEARVLKQHRGNVGIGGWKIQLPANDTVLRASAVALPQAHSVVRVRHAKRGCIEEAITLAEFLCSL